MIQLPMMPPQYGLLETALRSFGTEQSIEIRNRIERQVFREGLLGIVIMIDEDEYDVCVDSLCYLAENSGHGSECGQLIRHMKQLKERETWLQNNR